MNLSFNHSTKTYVLKDMEGKVVRSTHDPVAALNLLRTLTPKVIK